MDRDEVNSNKTARGIPRLSKLPQFSSSNKRSSQFLNAPLSSTSLSSSSREEIVVEQAPTTASSASRLAKRSSIASLPRPNPTSTSFTSRPSSIRAPATSRVAASTQAPRLNTRSVSGRSYRHSHTSSSLGWSPIEAENEDRVKPSANPRAPSRQESFDSNDSPTEPESLQRSLPAIRPRAPRPSLSDRAIESIQAVPATPKDRRQSSFFSNAESPMGPPPPRSNSVLSGTYGNANRPGTSDGSFAKSIQPPTSRISMSAKSLSRSSIGTLGGSQIGVPRRTPSSTLNSRLQSAREPAARTIRPASPTKSAMQPVRPMSPTKKASHTSRPLSPTKLAVRTNRPPSPIKSANRVAKAVSTADQLPSNGVVDKPLSGTGSKRTPENSTTSSSATLRQQISAARAAARKDRGQAQPGALRDHADDLESNGDGEHTDPFNQAPRDDKHILRNRIKTARMDGKLNISALGLKAIPNEVLSIYSAESVQESNVNWAEMVDLVKFIAADNELDAIPDDAFPDLSPEQLMQEENEQSGQFGGLELLDLHGNALPSLPLGIRRLERLTSLNLTHNKIENTALDVFAQVKTLRELRLGHNSISGTLPAALCSLPRLEVLDLQSNRLLTLPDAIRDLTALRTLDVSGNQLTALPMDSIAQLPLQELDASSNALIASLFPLGGSSQHRSLRVLNVANNSLAALTFSPELDLPDIHTLDVTNNHLALLPSVKGWHKLITLTAGDNKISELPEGFASLRNLRIVNLSGNELHVLPAEIALMESLTTLVLASNPLRHKKYLTMAAADIKQDLRGLLEHHNNRNEFSPDEYDDELASWGTAPEDPGFATCWIIKSGGVLDLSGKGLTDAINDSLGSFLRTNEVRQLKLSNNKLTTIPPALWLGHDLRSLDLSHNPLNTDYLSDELTLPMLTELDMSSCRIAVIEPLLQHLRAPEMQSLQLHGNRISGAVPILRQTYARLTTLLASDNKFSSVSVDALRGFMIVDLTSNELQSLPAEIGLLWDEGLKSFEVGRNAFRVPGHRVLEKGTQATMRWLKDRIKIPDTEDQTPVADAV